MHLDQELDAELARAARQCGESKASLLRRAARAFLDAQHEESVGGWDSFTGAVTDAPVDNRSHDEVIYGG